MVGVIISGSQRLCGRPNCLLQWLGAVALLAGVSGSAWSDHALTQEGTGLFNVAVEQTATTWSRPLRVRWLPGSFEYDYPSHQILQAHSGGSALFWLADVVTTETVLGKDEGREFMRARSWHRYTPPPPRVVVLPTPTPRPTPTPTPVVVARETELADQSLPLSRRLEKQREIFIEQQQGLVEQIRFALKMRQITEEEGASMRKKLLERQIRILTHYYPSEDEQVQLTRQALEDQLQKVNDKGKFSWEW